MLSTGDDSITTGATGSTITLSNGGQSLTVVGAAGGIDTITASAGATDTIVLTTGNASITSGVSGDVITLSGGNETIAVTGVGGIDTITATAGGGHAITLTSGNDSRFSTKCDPVVLLEKYKAGNPAAAAEFLLDLFLQGDVSTETRSAVVGSFAKAATTKHPPYWTATDTANHGKRAATHLVLTLPEFQLN